MELKITHLYPRLMNIYGDRGDITTIIYRCQKRAIKVAINSIDLGDKIPANHTNLIFGGGGQDRQQLLVASELIKRQGELVEMIESGIPGLFVCGTFQLFGHYFKTGTGREIPGIGLLDLYTIATSRRKIGNVVAKPLINLNQKLINRPTQSLVVGFENHSGNTFLGRKCRPFADVLIGFGNNEIDRVEGACYQNTIGTYLHGPLLPKNPHLADHLIFLALQRKYQIEKLEPLDDAIEWQAHQSAIRRSYRLKRRFWFFRF